MYRFQIGYRFKNGEVKGYVGYGFDEKTAEEKAYQKILEDLSFFKEPFAKENVLLSKNDVTSEELSVLRKDWVIG